MGIRIFGVGLIGIVVLITIGYLLGKGIPQKAVGV